MLNIGLFHIYVYNNQKFFSHKYLYLLIDNDFKLIYYVHTTYIAKNPLNNDQLNKFLNEFS